jgi:hypothetical protein
MEYNLNISSKKVTKVISFAGVEPVRAKIIVVRRIIEQVDTFKYRLRQKSGRL